MAGGFYDGALFSHSTPRVGMAQTQDVKKRRHDLSQRPLCIARLAGPALIDTFQNALIKLKSNGGKGVPGSGERLLAGPQPAAGLCPLSGTNYLGLAGNAGCGLDRPGLADPIPSTLC